MIGRAFKKAGRAIKGAYKALDDNVFQGFLPGGNSPFGKGTIAGDAVDSVKDVVRDPFGREFASDEADLARDHATAERLAVQEYNSAEALAAREFNAAEAQKARDHSLMLANTEYQRKMDSMRDAGLNPVLAAGGWGSGSQVPTSAQAQGAAASAHAGSSPSAAAASIAPMQSLLLAAQIRDISSAAKLKEEQANDLKITRDPRVNELEGRAKLIDEQINETRASTQQKAALVAEINKRIALLDEQISSAKSQAEIDKAVAAFETDIGGDIKRWSDAVGIKGRDITHLIGAVVGLGRFAKLFGGKGVTVRNQPDIIIPEGAKQKPFEIMIPPNWK